MHRIIQGVALAISVAAILPSVIGCHPSAEGASGRSHTERVNWLARHASALATVDPSQNDFSDLKDFETAVGEARLVMLGEASHGDGGAFLAKTRLIKFLHQEMGFDVLAFESGLYGCWKGWDGFLERLPPHEALGRCTFSLWTRSDQLLPLAEYLSLKANATNPLELTGFDIQLSGSAPRATLIEDLEAALNATEANVLNADHWGQTLEVLRNLTTRVYVQGDLPLPSVEAQKAFDDDISQAVGQLTMSSSDGPLWAQILESVRAYAKMVWLVDPEDLSPRSDDAEIREAGMTQNLLWLLQERYPDRKIIVWAATSHTARQLSDLQSTIPSVQMMYESVPTVGERIWRELGEEVYSVGFTAYDGQSGFPWGRPWSIGVADSGSIEHLLQSAGFELAFLDLRTLPRSGRWLASPLRSRPLGYQELEANWTSVLDGMVFIRTMTPSTEGQPDR